MPKIKMKGIEKFKIPNNSIWGVVEENCWNLKSIQPKIKELKVHGLKWKGVGIRKAFFVLIRDLVE
jgi:hypothetical protein